MSKSKSKSKAAEALKFLDDLDNLEEPGVPPTSSSAGSAPPTSAATNTGDAADVLKFIDEITLKSSEPRRSVTPAPLERPASRASIVTPTGTIKKATERVRVGSPAPNSGGSIAASQRADSSPQTTTAATKDNQTEGASKGSGWGWGSVWTSASAALQQAREVVDERVKHLPNQEYAAKLKEEVLGYVPKNLNREELGKLGNNLRNVGYSTFNDILNAVAPPISEHEIIRVWTSHDMEGYEGVESLVYKSLARIMEQVEGGDLIVNKGSESKPRDADAEKNMNPVEGLETAFRLAQANIDELVKSNPQNDETKPSSSQVPTTYSSVYLRIQPFFTTLPQDERSISQGTQTGKFTHIQFVLYLSDPGHQMVCSTVTQSVPAGWIDHWDEHDWIEDVVVDALRTGIETIGQEYIVARMGWLKGGQEGIKENPEADVETKTGESK